MERTENKKGADQLHAPGVSEMGSSIPETFSTRTCGNLTSRDQMEGRKGNEEEQRGEKMGREGGAKGEGRNLCMDNGIYIAIKDKRCNKDHRGDISQCVLGSHRVVLTEIKSEPLMTTTKVLGASSPSPSSPSPASRNHSLCSTYGSGTRGSHDDDLLLLQERKASRHPERRPSLYRLPTTAETTTSSSFWSSTLILIFVVGVFVPRAVALPAVIRIGK